MHERRDKKLGEKLENYLITKTFWQCMCNWCMEMFLADVRYIYWKFIINNKKMYVCVFIRGKLVDVMLWGMWHVSCISCMRFKTWLYFPFLLLLKKMKLNYSSRKFMRSLFLGICNLNIFILKKKKTLVANNNPKNL